VTKLLAGKLRNYGSNLSKAKNFSLLQRLSRPAFGPNPPPIQWIQGLFLQAKSNHEVMLGTHLN
jgi:hypothetical protein